jgi:hypothetical protein
MFREQRNLKFHEHCLWAFPSLVVKMTLRKTNRATCTREHTHVVHVSSLISTCARPMCTSLCGAQVSLCARQTNLTGNFICFGPGGECGRRGPWHPCAAHQHFSDSQVIFGDTKLFAGWMESGKSRRGRPFKLRRGHAILSAVVRKSCGRPWWK